MNFAFKIIINLRNYIRKNSLKYHLSRKKREENDCRTGKYHRFFDKVKYHRFTE